MKGKRIKNVLAILAVLVLASGAAFGATSAQVNLQGNIADNLSIAATAEAVASALVLTSTQTELKIATLTVTSNFKAFKIKATSANTNSRLEGALDPTTEYVAYQVKIETTGTLTTLSDTAALLYTGSAKVTDETYDLYIAYTGSSTLQADDYSDEITVTISKT